METKIIHQSEPEPPGAYFKVFVEDDYLIMEGRSTLGEDFRYKTKDSLVAFLKTRWSMATYSMSQYLLRYTSKAQVKFKGYYNVLKDKSVEPAMSSVYRYPEYEVWDIHGLLTENGIIPNEVTLNEVVLHSHNTDWQDALNELRFH